MKRLVVVVLAIGLVATLVVRGRRSEPRASSPTRQPPSARTSVPPSDLPPPPRSLAGTDVDGHVDVAPGGGELVVAPELRRFFEYYFAASGEDSDDVIQARVFADLDARLPPHPAAQAKDIFLHFLVFRRAAAELAPGRDTDATLAAIRDLRRRVFGKDIADRLFGDLDAPPHSAPPAALATLRAEEELRSAGATADDIRALRTARLGAEAAERLTALDQTRADFAARLAAFRAGGATDLSPFTPEEQVRVRALERLRGAPVPE